MADFAEYYEKRIADLEKQMTQAETPEEMARIWLDLEPLKNWQERQAYSKPNR